MLGLADEIVAAPKFAGQNLDINIVRALLYLQRTDPRIDQRVRQYLYGRQLNDLSQEAVAALDPNTGEGRAFEIIESLGRLMWTVDRAALVFCHRPGRGPALLRRLRRSASRRRRAT